MVVDRAVSHRPSAACGEMDCLLATLSSSPNIDGWQVEQAIDALTQYPWITSCVKGSGLKKARITCVRNSHSS